MHNSDRNRESVCDYACQRERVILTRGVICDMMKVFLIQQIRERIEAGMVMEQAVDEAVVTGIPQEEFVDYYETP